MSNNTNDTDLKDLVDVAMSGGIAIVAFLVAAIIWKIADALGMNPLKGGDDDGGVDLSNLPGT